LTVKIRPMVNSDKPEVMKILHTTPEFNTADVNVAEELIDSYLNYGTNYGYYILVAEVDKIPTGYICYGRTPLTVGTWDIYWIAVSTNKQRRGVGRTLLTSAESIIKNNHGRLILIETSSKPEYGKTRLFYKNQGYEVISRIPDFYALGDDRLIFYKSLH